MDVEQNFNIQFVSNITGINPHTIRAWEKRYSAIKPQRDQNGRRLYSNDEIERLVLLKQLVKMGNSISDIANLDKETLENIQSQYGAREEVQVTSYVDFNFEQSIEGITMALQFNKLDVLNHELVKAAEELSPVVFALKIVEPIIHKIRNLKEVGSISKDQRQQVYLLLKSYLSKKIYKKESRAGKTKKIVIAAAKGYLNELGAMMTAILCLDNHFEVEILGGNVDADSLGAITSHLKPDYVFIGLNYSYDTTIPLSNREAYLKNLIGYITPETKILIGAYDFCFRLPDDTMKCFKSMDEVNEFARQNL